MDERIGQHLVKAGLVISGPAFVILHIELRHRQEPASATPQARHIAAAAPLPP
jgi:hypothetical protein